MKLTAQEEYGLRCLIQVARRSRDTPEGLVSIREVAEAEGLSADYTAKLMRVLRQGGMLQSIRGATGGFRLSSAPEDIRLSEVLRVLDTPLYGNGHLCQSHKGKLASCVHTSSCSLRVLWRAIEGAMSQVLHRLVLADLLDDEAVVEQRIHATAEEA